MPTFTSPRSSSEFGWCLTRKRANVGTGRRGRGQSLTSFSPVKGNPKATWLQGSLGWGTWGLLSRI